MSRHGNKFNHSYADGVPLGTGDRYFAQDLARDHRYLQGLAAQALADLLGTDSAVLLRGGAVTAASATTIDVAAAVGLCDFDVSVPDDSVAWAVPADEATRQVKVRVSMPAQAGLSLATLGATLDGSTVNYLKLRYAEADAQSRSRQYAGGTYAHARADSFALSCDPAAPTAYDVVLATVVGNGVATPTVTAAPTVLTVGSTQKVVNLNADKVDGYDVGPNLGSINIVHGYLYGSLTTGTIYQALSTLIPNVGDRCALNGGLYIGTELVIFTNAERTSSTVMSLYGVRLASGPAGGQVTKTIGDSATTFGAGSITY